MAKLSRGSTFTTGVSGTAADLNNLVDAATILPGAITEQGAVLPDVSDSVLIYDASGSSLAKAQINDIINIIPSGAAAGTPSLRALGTTSTTAVAGNDNRLPAVVTGIRKGAGNGNADTAAGPKDFSTAGVNLAGGLAINWDLSDMFYDITLTGSATRNYTFSNVRSGRVITVVLWNMVAFTGSVTWPGLNGTAPAADHSAQFNVFTFFHTGNNLLGVVKAL